MNFQQQRDGNDWESWGQNEFDDGRHHAGWFQDSTPYTKHSSRILDSLKSNIYQPSIIIQRRPVLIEYQKPNAYRISSENSISLCTLVSENQTRLQGYGYGRPCSYLTTGANHIASPSWYTPHIPHQHNHTVICRTGSPRLVHSLVG